MRRWSSQRFGRVEIEFSADQKFESIFGGYTISQLGELDGHERNVMSLKTNRLIEGGKLLDQLRNMNRANDVTDEPGGVFGMMELDSGVVAGYVNVTLFVGVKTAGEWKENNSVLERDFFEERNV
ncbi:hypothetical protein F3Y22_tig00110021pilonHSYRG00013 [Hibiscus syriacus]|uniref:Uncharacterized protein n=1 Tax=Hibiscus syriacus TaxID=106335 RepID=A0A6A3BNT9_HIBSY|nr:hypothetical protein F3Y22_tig00110021pilonHSYRG00013 [Hibiscus syriacus]